MNRSNPHEHDPPPTPRRGAGSRAPLLVALLVLLLSDRPAAAGLPEAALRELDRLAEALADSVENRLAVPAVTILEQEGDAIRISLGSNGGIRSWSRVVLLAPGGAPWIGEVRDIEPAAAWLGPSANPPPPVPGTPPPAVGDVVRARLAGVRIGLLWPLDSTPGRGRLDEAFLDALGAALRLHHGWLVEPVAAHGDRTAERGVGTRAGLDLLLEARLDEAGDALAARGRLFAARRDEAYPEVRTPPSRDPALRAAASDSADSPRRPLPGTRFAWSVPGRPGALLDLFVRRWLWSDVYAVFDDRIEQWTLSPRGLQEVRRHDLGDLWPPVVGARWPVGTVVPVNTWYDEEGEESKVNYSVCSNRRPRYLTLNIDRAEPDSLWLAVGDGPLDSLVAATDGCFARLDRVTRPEGFVTPAEMPETARARLSLEAVVTGPSGVPTKTDSGRLLMTKVAVVYYDEPSATLWLSTPDGAGRVPGVFGGEMDVYRLGPLGAPGILVTEAAGPDEPDRLSFWLFTGASLERRWTGPWQAGSITALDAADRDGDGLEDVVYGVVRGDATGWVTDVHYLSSTPGMAEAAP